MYKKLLPFAILLIGLLIRIFQLGNWPAILWPEELWFSHSETTSLWITRLPNALLGSLSLWVWYRLIRDWMAGNEDAGTAKWIALISMAVLAVNPLHILLSREGAWIPLVGMLLMICWWYGVTWWTKKNIKDLIGLLISGLCLAWISPKGLIDGLFLMILWICTVDDRWRLSTKSWVVVLISIFAISLAMGDLGWLSSQTETWAAPHYPWMEGYFRDISLTEWFFSEVSQRSYLTIPYLSNFYWLELIGFLAGLWSIVNNGSKIKRFVIWWWILSPIPGLLTERGTAMKIWLTVLPMNLIIAWGWWWIISCQRTRMRYWLIGGLLLAYVWQFSYFWDLYTVVSSQSPLGA